MILLPSPSSSVASRLSLHHISSGLVNSQKILAIDVTNEKEEGLVDFTTAQSECVKTTPRAKEEGNLTPASKKRLYSNTRSYHYTMTGFAEQCVERYCELANIQY